MEEKTKNILLLIGILYLVIGVLFYLGTAITGYVIYLQTNYSLSITPDNFIYNSSQVLIENNKLSLYPNIITENITKENTQNFYIISAFRESIDFTDKVIALDNHTVNIDKSQKFNIIFDTEIKNGDVLRLYIKTIGEATTETVYLCNYDETCNINESYGFIYIEKEGWYNITIQNLAQSTDRFNLDPERLKIDYIDIVRTETLTYQQNIIQYLPEAELDSKEIILNGTVQAVLVDKILNNGAVLSFYSVDNGANWIPFEEVINSNYSNIKLKLVFESNQNQTPEVSEIKLIYLLPTEEILVNETNQTEQNINTETPASSSGGGGGGGGHSGRETPTEEIVTPEKTKQEIYRIPAMQPQSEKKIVIGETEVPKPASNVPFLVGLTAKIVYSGKNIGSFLLENWGWLILIILLLSAYVYLYLRRRKDRMRRRRK